MQKARSQPRQIRRPAQPPTACKYVVSETLSLPALGYFSPFPHGTRSLSVTQESLALEGGPPGFTPDSSELGRYSGTLLAHPLVDAYRAFPVYGSPFQENSANTWVYPASSPPRCQPPAAVARSAAPFARRYLGHLG